MTIQSPRLALPFLLPAQAQKHVTHNEALERLDMLVQLAVEAFDALEPPIVPEDGQIWALGTNPSGAWSGQGGKLAAWNGTNWQFLQPQAGWHAVQGEYIRLFDGGDWVHPAPGPQQNVPGIGINTEHDSFNRLAVAASATLLSHEGTGHQLKINKANAAETASLLFQTDWSGRAEMGTVGGDDFFIKVSPDGTIWHDGMVLDRTSGAIDTPNGLTIAGHSALHMGNLLGPVGQSAGIPTGAVIEQDDNANGHYVRFADGTQICLANVNAGDPTAYGAGTFGNPYRTDISVWTYPAVFVVPPQITGRAWIASSNGNDRRMLLSTRNASTTAVDAVQAFRVSDAAGTADCIIELIAFGRWF